MSIQCLPGNGMTQEEYNKAIVTIGKDELASLPVATYKGQITVVDHLSKVKEAIDELKTAPLLGFDTETRPSFRKGVMHNVALIQLATTDRCILFRTNTIGYPKELIELLENPEILKVGLSIHDDFHNLRRVTSIEPQGFIDLQTFVKGFKIHDNSLSRVFGILFDHRISKGQRLSNWESTELTEAQQNYAALDAYACIKIYDYLKEGNFDPSKSKYLRILPEPQEEKEGENT